MERKADDEIKRNPGQVEQRDQPHPGKKSANVVEVTQRLRSLCALPRLERQMDERVIDAAADRFVEVRADPDEDPASDQIEYAKNGIHECCDKNEGDKGGDTATW